MRCHASLRVAAFGLAISAAGPLALGSALAQAPAQAVQPSPSVPSEADVEAALRRYRHEPRLPALVAAAIRLARAEPERAQRLARRSRLAGFLPAVRLGARRGRAHDESASQSGSGDRTNLSADEDLTLEASLSFRFDRLAYGDDEVAWMREERALTALRIDVARTVVELYFERRRIQLERDLLRPLDVERALRLAELEALIDALTGGAFRGRGGVSAQADGRAGPR